MKRALFRFYAELNDFLSKERRKVEFPYNYTGNPTIKSIIEMIGVPHSEIDLIIVNGTSVNFDYRLQDSDRVSVYPVFESIDITPINHLRPIPLRNLKFILDVHLGRLTKYLRICGFDCYFGNLDDDQIVAIAVKEKRIILTKDRGLLKNKKVTHGYWVRADNPRKQLLEIFERFDLKNKLQFLARCLICNQKLQSIGEEVVRDQVPTKTTEFYHVFYRCDRCNKIYWQGSHYKNMAALIDFVRKQSSETQNRK